MCLALQVRALTTGAERKRANLTVVDFVHGPGSGEGPGPTGRIDTTRTGHTLTLVLVDGIAFCLAAVAATVAYWRYSGLHIWNAPTADSRFLVFLTLGTIGIGWLRMLGHHTRRRPFWDELREIVHVIAVLAVTDAALLYLGKIGFSRFWFLASWSSALVLIPTLRVVYKTVLLGLGRWQIPTVVLGAGENALGAAEALNSERLMGFDVVAFCALNAAHVPRAGLLSPNGRPVPVIHSPDMVRCIKTLGSPNVVVALEAQDFTAAQPLIRHLHREFHDLSIVPPLKGLPLYGMEIGHFFRHEALFLRVRNNLGRRGPRIIKRAFDIVGSFILLLALSPLFALIGWGVRRSGGSAFFGHQRVGRNGTPFTCYKFRSMVPDAEQALTELLATDPRARAEWRQNFKLKNDPRITPIGEFLRKTSLDELPQLWNVLKGDMSLVGPRPVVAEELERYGDEVAYYLEARPGITGLWQISGRNDTDYEKRVQLDTWYVKNWAVWYDIVILLKTVRVVVQKWGAY